jgi:D-alanyl-D-alanine carboxypeptidase
MGNGFVGGAFGAVLVNTILRETPKWLQVCWLSFLLTTFSFISNGTASEKLASIVMDASSSKVLHSSNAHQRLHPAGLTKLMTLYVALEAIKNKEISADTIVTVSRKAASEPPSRMGLRTRQKVKFKDLIIGIALMDANDAATAIAEGISGTEGAFANRMNLLAKSLGMINTTFKNASGFIEKGHLSSAFDMAILGRRLILDFPDHTKILSERESSTDLGRRIRNQNIRILDSYKEIDAVKSGYSRRSGYNFFATAKKNGLRLIIVSFGNGTTKAGIQEVEKLFDIGFSTLGLDPSS